MTKDETKYYLQFSNINLKTISIQLIYSKKIITTILSSHTIFYLSNNHSANTL